MGFKPPAYTQTPNEIFDEWLPKLKLVELRVLMVIIRKTFGWHKIRDQLSITQLCNLTGSHREDVINAANSLHALGLIQKEVTGESGDQKTFYTLALDDEPSEIPTHTTSEKPTTPQSELATPPSRNHRPTKETLTKEKKEERERGSPSAPPPSFFSYKEIKIEEETYQALVKQHGEDVILDKLEDIWLYEEAKGGKRLYKNYASVITKWLKKDAKEGKTAVSEDFKKNKKYAEALKKKYPEQTQDLVLNEYKYAKIPSLAKEIPYFLNHEEFKRVLVTSLGGEL